MEGDQKAKPGMNNERRDGVKETDMGTGMDKKRETQRKIGTV